MWTLVVLTTLALASIVQARNPSLDDVWSVYKKTHKKNYSSEKEEIFRREIWEENVKHVQKHNLEYDMGVHTYTLGINEYADLTFKEYTHYLLGARPSMRTSNGSEIFYYKPGYYPKNVDWRQEGYVTPIKNQGQCGSCWAFSSTGSLEGQHFKKTGKLVSLSEQNLVDCTKKFGNGGCNGGWMDNAFKYVEFNNGIDLEVDYPYEAKDDICRYKKAEKGAACMRYVDVDKSERSLMAAVAKIGPISVAIDATHQSFQLYRSGVYYEPECSNSTTDHAVLAVGYGTYEGQDYWLVKNSWGLTWGMDGYIMMSRNKDNNCAIASFASYPVE